MNEKKKILRFKDQADLISAIELSPEDKVEDIISPYPVDIRRPEFRSSSIIGIFAFIIALIVITLSIYFQYWTTTIDYPLNIGGREFFYWIFSIPITYELALLIAAAVAFAGFLIFTGLPKWHGRNEVFYSLDDNFAIIYGSGETDDITNKLNIKGIDYKIEDI